jgi:Flp pilus assembly protein TadD
MPALSRVSLHRLGLGLVCGLALLCTGCGVTGGWVMNNSGMGYYQQGNYAMARHEFSHAVAEAPWNPDYRHNLALSLKRMGDVGGAERVLRHNLTVNAMHQPTYHSLAVLMNEQGRQGEAHELVQTWAETQPYLAGSHIEMAWLQREMGNMPDAERELRHALQIEPQNPIALAHLGQIYQDAGQSTQAASLYQRSLAMNMNQPQVQTRLANVTHSRFHNPESIRLASYSNQLPPPVFDGAMMAAGPSPAMPMGAQPTPMAMQSTPQGAPMMMSSQPLPGGMPMSSAPMETIIIPPEHGMPHGAMMTTTVGPEIVLPPPGVPPATSTTTAKPAPTAGWQPVPQTGTAKSVNADPAHAPDVSALPTVDVH